MAEKWPIRVIVSDDDIRRIKLDARPSTLESFLTDLKVKLDLPYDFKLMYEDPVFNNGLCNLDDVSDLPDVPTLKIVRLESLSVCTPRSSTPSTSDTDTLSPSQRNSPAIRQEPWPSTFFIPEFCVSISYRLRQADLAYMKDETTFKAPRDIVHEILEKLAETMYKYTAYAQMEQCQQVAYALISKHPSLREPGSPTGCEEWKNRIYYKVSNYRRKMNIIGMADDVALNADRRKRGAADGEPLRPFKRGKRGETNFFPNLPEGGDENSLETLRRLLESEEKKRFPDSADVKNMMDCTFALRRQEIVEGKPTVKRVMERWPVLFTDSQVWPTHAVISNHTACNYLLVYQPVSLHFNDYLINHLVFRVSK